ncbi:YjcZ family sporulation protein [Bacillus sp. APMAM]|nr:YjcZ family sporulation protein [Bacillus sp. APMAM]
MGAALAYIVVLFILLIIVGTSSSGRAY